MNAFKNIKIPGWAWWAVTSALLFTGGSWANLEKEQLVTEIVDAKESVTPLKTQILEHEKLVRDEVENQEKLNRWQERQITIIETKMDYVVEGVKEIKDEIKQLNRNSRR